MRTAPTIRAGGSKRAGSLLAALVTVVLLASPSLAENPVLDAEGDADVADALAEAQQVQGVCYGYVLEVSDFDTGQFGGTFTSSSAGAGRRITAADACPNGAVELLAFVTYTSSFSEAADSATWQVVSTLEGGQVRIEDVEAAVRSSASDLLDDATSETALLNAVLSLPGLASEQAGVAPVVLDPNTEPLPSDARATDTPGSDWLRENGALLALCVLAIAGGVVALLASRRRPSTSGPSLHGSSPRPPGRMRTFGPTPVQTSQDPFRSPEPRPTDPRTTDRPWSDT